MIKGFIPPPNPLNQIDTKVFPKVLLKFDETQISQNNDKSTKSIKTKLSCTVVLRGPAPGSV